MSALIADFVAVMDLRQRLHLQLLERTWSAYHFWGIVGFVAAVGLAFGLALCRDLSAGVMVAIGVVAVLTFIALAIVTKVLTGCETLIYYHHEIAVMIVSGALLRLLRQPVIPYLEITLLAVGIFLAFGRIGCLMVGCCHGHPHRFGICYHNAHAAAGLPHYLIGVRLFPIQAVESIWVGVTVLLGAFMLASGHPAGGVLTWFVIIYGSGRFVFEFARGDSARPYFKGLSEAQWTTLILMATVIWAEWRGLLPFRGWHSALTGVLVVTAAIVLLRRHVNKIARHQILDAGLINEVAQALYQLSRQTTTQTSFSSEDHHAPEIAVVTIPLGVQISFRPIRYRSSFIYHYALSNPSTRLTRDTAATYTNVIHRISHPCASVEILKGNANVYHLFYRE